MYFISELIKISVFLFLNDLELLLILFSEIFYLIISFANDKCIFDAEVLDIWLKIFSAVGLFLLTFFMWDIASNIWFSITQFYCFHSMMILENNSRKCKQRAIDATEVVKLSHWVKLLPNYECDALHDLASFAKFEKHEKTPWRNVTFSKVTL